MSLRTVWNGWLSFSFVLLWCYLKWNKVTDFHIQNIEANRKQWAGGGENSWQYRVKITSIWDSF